MLLRKKVKSDFIAHWKTRIGNPEVEKKLSLYSKVKEDFQVGNYLEMPSFKNRQIISKFLCSSHKLRIETGRHSNIPREQRVCQLCETNKVEDEHHFILECQAYNEIRKDTPIQFENYNSPEAIFHLEDPTILAEFLWKAYNKRDQLTVEEPETYRIAEKSENGMKLVLCKGKDTPGRLRVKNITKDGLRLKIYRTSTTTPFGTQSDWSAL